MNLEREKAIRSIVESSIKKFVNRLYSKHDGEAENPKEVINNKKKEYFCS